MGAARRKRRWLRRLLLAPAVLLAVVVVLVVVVLILLQTRWAREQVVALALAQINAGIRGEIRVGAVEGNLLTRISVADVIITDPDGSPALALGHLDVKLEPLRALEQTLWIDRLAVSDLKMVIEDDEARVRLARAFEPTEPPPPPEPPGAPTRWRIVVDELSLDGVTILQSDAPDAPGARNLSLALRAVVGAAGIRWQGLKLDAALQGLPVANLHLTATGSASPDRIELADLRLDAGPHRLRARGSIANLARPVLDLEIERARVALGALGALGALVGLPDLRGTALLEARAAGALYGSDAIDFDARLATSGGDLRFEGEAGIHGGEPWYAFTLRGDALRPKGLLPDFQPEIEADLELSARGSGDPRGSGHALLTMDLLRLDGVPPAPLPLYMEARAHDDAARVVLEGASEADGTISLDARADDILAGPYTLALDLGGIELATFAPLAGQPEVGGFLHNLRVDARATMTGGTGGAGGAGGAGGRPEHAEATAHLDLRRAQAPTPEGPAGLGRLLAESSLRWEGSGLPRGTLNFDLGQAWGAGASVDSALGELTLEEGGRGHGSVAVAAASWRDEAEVARVEVPLSFELGPDLMPRSAKVAPRVAGARYREHRVGELTADLAMVREGDAYRVRGPLSVGDLGSGRDLALTALRAETRASLAGDGSIAGNVALKGRGLKTGSGQRVGELRVEAELAVPRGDANAASVVGSVALANMVATPDIRARRLSGRFDAGLRGGVPGGTLSLDLRNATLPGRPLAHVTVEAALRRDTPSELRLLATDGSFAAEVDTVLLGRPDGVSPLVATVRRARVADSGGGFALQPGAVLTYRPDTGVVAAERLRVEEIAPAPGSLAVDGTFDPAAGTVSARAKGEGILLERWIESTRRLGIPLERPFPVAGLIVLDASVEGTLAKPEASVHLSLENGVIDRFDDLDLGVDASIDNTGTGARISAGWDGVRRLSVEVGTPVRMRLDGRQKPAMETPIHLAAQLERVDLADFAPLLPASPSAPRGWKPRGLVDGAVAADGSLAEPVLHAVLELEHIDYYPLTDGSFQLDASLAPDGFSVESRLTVAGEERLNLKAAAPADLVEALRSDHELLAQIGDAPLDSRLVMSGFRLTELPFTEALGDYRDIVASAELALTGRVGAPHIDGHLRAEGVPIESTPTDFLVDLRTKDDDLYADVNASSRRRELLGLELRAPKLMRRLVRGQDPLLLLRDPDLAVRLSTRLPPDTVIELAPDIGPSLGRMISGAHLGADVTIRGSEAGPELLALFNAQTLEPQRPLRELGLGTALRLLVQVDPASAHVGGVLEQGEHGGYFEVDADLAVGTASLLDGTMPEAPEVKARMRSVGLRLEGLSKALPRIFGPSKGVLAMGAVLGGTTAEPDFKGHCEAKFSQLDLAIAGLRHKDVTLGFTFDREALKMVPIRLEKGGGTMAADLEVRFADFDPAHMALDGKVAMKRFKAVDRRDAEAELTGDVTVAGTLLSPSVSGKLRLDEGLFSPEMGGRSVHRIGLPGDVVFVDAAATEQAEEAATPGPSAAAGSLDLNLTLVLPPRRLRIKNEMLDILLGGDLGVTTLDGAPSVEGVITVLFGRVEIFGREFNVEEDSQVILGGGAKIDPTLDIRAHYSIADVDLSALGLEADASSKITVTVSGTAEKPKLQLTSDPAMDETNILSILSVGHPVGGGGDDEESMQARMLNLFVGLALGGLTRLVTESLPIDVVKVKAGAGGLSEAEITVGTRLTRDLSVLYQANLGAAEGENVHQLRMEYSLTRIMSLETHFGDAGEGGIELMFRWRF